MSAQESGNAAMAAVTSSVAAVGLPNSAPSLMYCTTINSADAMGKIAILNFIHFLAFLDLLFLQVEFL